MRPTPKGTNRMFASFPRVSGDAPDHCRHHVRNPLFSPRERGCAGRFVDSSVGGGVFPA